MIKTTEMMLEELKEYSNPASKLSRMAKQGECFPIVRGYMRLTGQFRDIYWQGVSMDRPIFLSVCACVLWIDT